ncbi:MAG: Gfo/Idh/MocA family oxidoreductase [Planctomycetia bacterium]|nr:Gfo/Idh/MocA family oxidoreductase [Planctomycetia bacterium]
MMKQTRRNFLKTTSVLSAAAVAGLSAHRVHAGETSLIKIGLIGCGGRGCGAVADAMSVDDNIRVTHAADLFPERGKAGIEGLKNQFEDKITVSDDTLFFGFDGYKKVLESDVDSVILATPQHFRPVTLRDAVAANKHVFCEKPVAVDGAGIRMVMAAAEEAKSKGLNLVSGLCNRYYAATMEAVKRIHDGAIGDVICCKAHRMGGELWRRPRLEGDTEMQYQMRNWVNFCWIASEYINDVTIHQLDVALWCMGDPAPTCALGMGGRLTRRYADTGDMYDSMTANFEFADGRFLDTLSRQIPGTYPDGTTFIYGTKGQATIANCAAVCEIRVNGKEPFSPEQGKLSGLQYEHKVLLDAIRSGGSSYVNNGSYMANSTLCCILGRMAAYSGDRVTYEEALASEQDKPESYSFDTLPPTLPDERGQYKIAMPHEGWAYL